VTDDTIRALQVFLEQTDVARTMRQSVWLWAIFESVHFAGMSLLVGIVGLFDLRLLGFARGVPYAAFHRLIPLGVAGFAANALTGICFVAAFPGEYLFNAAFQLKLALMLVAALNVVLFYAGTFKGLKTLGPEAAPPLRARMAGAVSLCAWVGVMSAGRLITFFRGDTGISFGP
jgi:hypothetical protein